MRPTLPRLVTTLVLLLGPGPIWAADPPAHEPFELPPQEDVRAFQEALGRFRERMVDLERETDAYVDVRRQEEETRVTSGYDLLITNLEAQEATKAAQSLEKFEAFLKKYPDSVHSDHVRFRLAELYYETDKEAWLQASTEYAEAVDAAENDLDKLAELEEKGDPRLDMTRAMKLYEEIIAQNRKRPKEERYEYLGGVYNMLAFCYFEDNSAQYDLVRAESVFRELLTEVPDYEFADDVHLLLGFFLFEQNNFEGSMAEYRAVLEKGPEGRNYVGALYQLAWANYKLSRYDEALAQFLQILDINEKEKREKGRPNSYAPDALKFMAHSFIDLSLDNENAIEVAQGYFAKVAQDTGVALRPYEHDVYVALAELLEQYIRPTEALAVYEALQTDPRFQNHPDNPKYQATRIRLLGVGLAGDPIMQGQARLDMTTRYGEGSTWWEATRNNPDARDFARQEIESSLLQVAVEMLVRAQTSNAPEDYAAASVKYREYLDKFPISDDYYKQQWFYASSLLKGGKPVEADAEYASLARTRRYHGFGDGAIWSLMQTRSQRVETEVGKTGDLEANATVEKTYTTESGKEVQVYGLVDVQRSLVEAIDRVVAHKFADSFDGKESPYKEAIEEKRVSLMYVAAQVLHVHNRFDESRPRMLEIIEKYPRTNEASYAAGDIVDSYQIEGNLERLRHYTRMFSGMVLGPVTVADPQGKFRSALEIAEFNTALEFAKAEQFDDAAEAFLSFVKEFPTSENAPDALFNAGKMSEASNKAEKAIGIYEDFVAKYPADERSKALYFKIAANYERVLELAQAVDYYGRLVKKFPDYVDSPIAQLNMSFLKMGLKDFAGAAKGYEDYARLFPKEADREEVFYRAGAEWEEVSEAKAVDFYQRYLREYGGQSPNRTISAWYRLAEVAKKRGDTRAYNKNLDELLEAYGKFEAAGAQLKSNAIHYAAEAGWRPIEASFAALSKDKLTGNSDKDAALLDKKPAEMKAFVDESSAFMNRFPDFDYVTAAFFHQAQAVLYYADLGHSIRPPKGLSEDDALAYEDILQSEVYPKFDTFEDQGIDQLSKLVDLAKRQKRHSVWVDKAYEEMNNRRPADFPDVKVEKTGVVDSSTPTRIVPVTPPDPKKFPAPAPAPAPAPLPAPTPAPAPGGGTP